MIAGLNLIEKEITDEINETLSKIGVLYRLFSRTKDRTSIQEKTERKKRDEEPYEVGGKLMQDIIGIRIVTYFKDDVELVYSILNNKLKYSSEEIDDLELTVFKPKRTNVICSLNKKHTEILKEVKASINDENFKIIDNTFELQLRTVLSEGWHEIDHSLRYKCKEDWESQKESERMLNGIYATLETNDIVLKNLFNDLAYKHYKNSNWEGLIRNKFRLKFLLGKLDPKIIDIINKNNLGKKLLQIDRENLIMDIHKMPFSIPINFNNLTYLLNIFCLKDKELSSITPKHIFESISE